MTKRTFLSVLIAMVLLEIVLFPFLWMSSNPFIETKIVGEVRSFDTTHQAIAVLIEDDLILLRLGARFAGQIPAVGCTFSARGKYQPADGESAPVFVATVLIIQACPKTQILPASIVAEGDQS